MKVLTALPFTFLVLGNIFLLALATAALRMSLPYRELWLTQLVVTSLNVFYFVWAFINALRRRSRISRLIDLWFDAKDRELRKRAGE